MTTFDPPGRMQGKGATSAEPGGFIPIEIIGDPGPIVVVVVGRNGTTTIPGGTVKSDGGVNVPSNAQPGDRVIVVMGKPPHDSINIPIISTNSIDE